MLFGQVKSCILIIDFRATRKKKSDLWDIACIDVKLNTGVYKAEMVAISSVAFLPIKAADSPIIG
jgi:hypothetical protein